MKNKVLIYKHINEIKPTGGPAGYIYNLQYGLDKINYNKIEYLSYHENQPKKVGKIKAILPKPLVLILQSLNRYCMYKKILVQNVESEVVNLNEYKIIHFHSTLDIYKNRKILQEYKGKVILTSHSPKPLHLEIVEDCFSELDRKLFGKFYKKLEQIDEYAFNRADYIVFPCEYAEEPYYNTWEKYKEVKLDNIKKYKYLYSGIKNCKFKMKKNEVLNKYKIPEDKFIVCYVGRHNTVKGYDKLKEIGRNILEKRDDVYFLIAGKEEPLTGIKHENWIEVGWTNDPYSIIHASDIFLLPNKETYFDLIMLEALSLGKGIVASNTGGNKLFKDLGAKSVITYNSTEEATNVILELINMQKVELESLGQASKELFNQEFTAEKFASNYIKLIEEILKESDK